MDIDPRDLRMQSLSARLEVLAIAGWLVSGCAILWFSLPERDISHRELCGEPALRVYRARERSVERLREGDAVSEGDLVQLSYLPRGAAYGAILSIDGWGVITRHLPEQGGQSVSLEPDAEVRLDHAFRLDDAPEYERFLLATSCDPFPLEPIEEGLRSGRLPNDLSYDWFELVR